MLQQKRTHSFSNEDSDFIFIQNISAGEEMESEEGNSSLDDTARTEREYVRGRLQAELKREPTEQEVDEWLRQHTEGY